MCSTYELFTWSILIWILASWKLFNKMKSLWVSQSITTKYLNMTAWWIYVQEQIYLSTYLQRQNISCTKTFDRIKLWTWDFQMTVYKHQNILLLINRSSFYRTAVDTFTTKRKRANWMNIFGLFSPPLITFLWIYLLIS